MDNLANADLTEDQIAEFFEAFTMFDKGDNGVILLEDLKVLFRSLGQTMTEDDIRHMVDKVGLSDPTCIDFSEFLKMMSVRLALIDNEDILQEAFRVFDRDGSGCITAQELRHVMVNMGASMDADEVDAMITEADHDEDGVINFDDFVKALVNKRT